MKKTILSLVVAGSLLVASPLTSSAQQLEGSTNPVYERFQVSISTNNDYNWNEIIQRIINRYYYQKQAVQQPTKQPVQQQPIQQQPAQQNKQTEAKPVQQAPVKQPVQPPSETANDQTAAYELNQYEKQVISLTNNERAKYGLPPLKTDVKLSEVARAKSADMKGKGYFSHRSPTYGSPFDMMKQFGVSYRTAGENIAMGQRSPEEVVKAWMNSEGHRKNILSSSFTHIGVGHVQGNYWTQMFIGE